MKVMFGFSVLFLSLPTWKREAGCRGAEAQGTEGTEWSQNKGVPFKVSVPPLGEPGAVASLLTVV